MIERVIKKIHKLLIPAILILSVCLTGCAFLEDMSLSGSNSGQNDYTISEDTVKEPVERTVEEILCIEPVEEEEQEEEPDAGAEEPEEAVQEQVQFHFRSKKLLDQHYEKHGIEMGFASAEEYEKAASDVINNPAALRKTETEDGDYVFYVEETNEFVVVSTDGFIRTYFLPDSGKAYYDRQ